MQGARIRTILIILVFAAHVGGCSDNPLGQLGPGEYVVFGDFYGECLGAGCVDIFKIQDGKVYEDSLDRYPTASKLPHETSFVQIPCNSYEELSQIFSEIPTDLFSEDRTVIGQPDAGDWGGYYLETRLDGETRYWLIDKMEDNLPSYLRPFVKQLDDAISLAETLV